ncbi:MAG TPA: aspartate kinase, partial [Burkholderiaceae bacterium]|nr:aspartate kinase [Burkholderiaceae bacterium]
MWVVKLGGSLSRDPRLPLWLDMLAEYGRGRVTVVPGGAAFADAVRDVHAHWGFDEVAAHNMAVLAMAQTAHMLHALEPRLVLVSDEAAIRRTLHSGRPALWLPMELLRDAPDVLTSWDVTSDSLALWL